MNFYHEENILKELISKYEVMSQKGTVCFFEKTVLLDLITHYENEDDLEKAMEVCDIGISQHASSMEFLYHKSRFMVEFGDVAIALEYLEKALLSSPDDFELNLLQAEIWIELGEFDDAYFLLKKLYKGSSVDKQSQTLFLLAKIHEINGNFEKMFYALRKALKSDPHHPILLNKIWLAAELAGLSEESVDFHLQLIEEHPYSFLAWYNLGQAYICQENYEAAAEAFEYVFIINKQFDIAFKDAAEANIMCENFEKALEIYDEYLETSEADSDILGKRGLCLERVGQIEEAKACYRKSIQMNPSNSMPLFRMGECYMYDENWDEAIKFYNQAIEADCNHEEYLIALAEAYVKNKNVKQAKKFFQKATDMAPELGKYWTQYAMFLMKLGNSEEAFSILDEAQIYSVDTEVLYCKAACLFAMSKREEALKTLSMALQENASLLESLFALTPELEQDSEVKALVRIFK